MSPTTMHTISGSVIDFADPWSFSVHPSDLFAGLRAQTRYRGQTQPRITVLDHLVLGLALECYAPRERLRWWSLHDLHEAYWGDHPSPMYQADEDLRRREKPWEEAAHAAFGVKLPEGEDAQWVRTTDLRCLLIEMKWVRHASYTLTRSSRQVPEALWPTPADLACIQEVTLWNDHKKFNWVWEALHLRALPAR